MQGADCNLHGCVDAIGTDCGKECSTPHPLQLIVQPWLKNRFISEVDGGVAVPEIRSATLGDGQVLLHVVPCIE